MDRERRQPPRVAMAGATVALVLGVAPACGLSGGTTSFGPTTTAVPLTGRASVAPAEGPVGTVFTITAETLRPGDAVQFEITFPGAGRAFPGNALVVGEDGTVTATYRATSANAPGAYEVRVSGPTGLLATASFAVTNGRPVTSAVDKASTSSTKGGSTTTKKAPTTTKTTKPGATTTTGATTPTTTPKPTTPTTAPVTTPPTTTPTTTSPPTT